MVAAFKDNHERDRFYRKHKSMCFYTGLVCSTKGPHIRSVEHLVSPEVFKKWKDKTYKDHLDNMVVSVDYINSRVGNAPLGVKYALRSYLRNLCTASVTPFQLKDYYTSETSNFLKAYKPGRFYVWNYDSRRVDSFMQAFLFNEFTKLLSPAEKQMFYPELIQT